MGLVLWCKRRKTRKSKPSSAPTSCQFDNPTYETNENPPETKEDDYYSSVQSDNDPRYAEGEKYPGIQENECASTTFMSMSIRRLLLLGRLLLRLTRHMKGNELFTFKRITRSLFSFHLLIHINFVLEHA